VTSVQFEQIRSVIPNPRQRARAFRAPFTPGVPSARGFRVLGWTAALAREWAEIGVRLQRPTLIGRRVHDDRVAQPPSAVIRVCLFRLIASLLTAICFFTAPRCHTLVNIESNSERG
jgi:hypothetical protein